MHPTDGNLYALSQHLEEQDSECPECGDELSECACADNARAAEEEEADHRYNLMMEDR